MEPRWWVEFRSFRSSYLQPSKIYAGICTVPFHCFNLQQLQRVYFQNIFVFCFRRCYQVWLFFTFFLKFFIDTPVETSSYSFGRELNFHLCFNSTRLHFLSKCWNCSSKKSNSGSVLKVGQHCMWRILHIIDCFHSRGQHLCKFIETKESVCIRKEFNSQRIGLGHQHGRRFTVLGHQYGRRDVMWKHSKKC